MKKFALVCVLLMVVLSGCLPGVHAKETVWVEIVDGRVIDVDARDTGLTDEDDVLFITAPIVDKFTGEPVKATVYYFEAPELRAPRSSEVASVDTDHVRVALRFVVSDSEDVVMKNWLVVDAPGYQRWAVEVTNSATGYRPHYRNTVELVPVGLRV